MLSTLDHLSRQSICWNSITFPHLLLGCENGCCLLKYLAFFYPAGSVVMERAGNEKSDLAQKLANYNLLNYQFWWDMPFLYWCASFYSNPLILSYRQAYEQGALLGDGRTATEM
jgi:hypothetical protein